MPPDPGHFEIKTPRQLFNKMVHDANLIAKYPADSYACFNFFVTAEHMADWLLPGDANKAARSALRSDPVLKICAQLANGAKHFETLDKRHKSISGTNYTCSTRIAFDGKQPPPAQEQQEPGVEFVIELEAAEAAALGVRSLTVRQLVTRILDFWEPRVKHLPMFEDTRKKK